MKCSTKKDTTYNLQHWKKEGKNCALLLMEKILSCTECISDEMIKGSNSTCTRLHTDKGN